MRHRSAWARSGQPDPAAWAASNTVTAGTDRAECGLPLCTLCPENDKHLFCKSPETRWRRLGRPAVEDYVAHCLRRGKARIDFRGLTAQRQAGVGSTPSSTATTSRRSPRRHRS